MADIDKLSSDARALKFDLGNKRNALKNASSWTETISDAQRKNPSNQKYVSEKTAIQKKAQEDLNKTQVAYDKAIDLLNKAKEYQRLNPPAQDKQKLIDEANRRGEVYKEPVPKEVTSQDPTQKSVDSTKITEEFNSKLINSGQYIAKLSDEERRSLAIELNKVYELKLPTNGKYSANLKDAYQRALNDNLLRSLDYNRSIPFEEFLIISDKEGTYKPAAVSGTGQGKPRSQISNPTEAAATINTVIKNVFNRDATPKEIKDLTKKLNDAERKNPFKTVNGVTTGGLNDQQFLLDILKVTPEFAKRKTEGSNIDAQTIRGTARSNFLELSDVQVNNFLKDVQGGQDINTIRNRIRNIAAMGMPDSIKKMVADGTDLETIYQPYKNRMASILELNPETIDINDATLRSAIGADREMPLYEFEKALRKDSRWQYTTNARDKISEIATRISRDFGFEA